MEAIKLWQIIDQEQIKSINRAKVDYEARLETWIKNDISIISNNLMVIGTQVQTSYGHKIDILAINSSGELVIIELKRNETYREVVAQGLDYATWVKNLTYDEINTIFNKNNPDTLELSETFSEKFNREIEEYNTDHKILIVGSEIDDSTKRIIEYLSGEPYNVNINALSFNYFKDSENKEYLAQSFILPESNIIEPSKTKTQNRKPAIIKELFKSNKLQIGQKLVFKPAQELGQYNETDFTAIIKNDQTNCLKRAKDSQCYSLSKLRAIIVNELGLTNVRANWGFGVRYEWITEDGKSLGDLNNEP
jgi:tRNA(Leu) C34 or U34 (ribose-2'-O)-methylase TrmL